MACRFCVFVQILLALSLALYLDHCSVEAHVPTYTISREWKRSSTGPGVPTQDDDNDWASLERELRGDHSPASSEGDGSSSASSVQKFHSWLRTYNPDLADEMNRARSLQRFPTGQNAAIYQWQGTRTVPEIRREIKEKHGEAYQRLLQDERRKNRHYEGSYKRLVEQENDKTITTSGSFRLEEYRRQNRERQRKYKQRKKSAGK